MLVLAEDISGLYMKCLLIVPSGKKRILESGVKGRLIYTAYLFVHVELFPINMFYFSNEKKN